MNIGVIGQKYEGKSTLAIFLADCIRRNEKASEVFVFDPKWAFRNREMKINHRTVHLNYTEDIGEFSDMVNEDESEFLCYRPQLSFSEDDDEVVKEDFSSFCEAIDLEDLLRQASEGTLEAPVVLLLDEASYLQEGRQVHGWLAVANRLAVKGKIFIIQAVHAPKEIAPKLRRELDEIYFFRQNEPVDLDAIRERCGNECAEIISQLPLHHVLVFYAKTRTYKIWSDPSKWYVDISAERRRNGKDENQVGQEQASSAS